MACIMNNYGPILTAKTSSGWKCQNLNGSSVGRSINTLPYCSGGVGLCGRHERFGQFARGFDSLRQGCCDPTAFVLRTSPPLWHKSSPLSRAI